MIRMLGAYLLSILTAYVLAAIMSTQWVVFNLGDMGLPISFGQRISMTGHDLIGMAGMFLPMIAAGFLAAFLLTSLLIRWLGQWRSGLFILAGAVALISVHLLLNIAFGITPVAAARTWAGLLAQGMAGAAGGYVFTLLLRKKRM